MQWTKPEFVEIPLGMEVTAYVNTDSPTGLREPGTAPRKDPQAHPVREASSQAPER